MKSDTCRVCGGSLQPVLDLGTLPLADELFADRNTSLQAQRYPLQVGVCSQCHWAQLLELPRRDVLFGEDYPYYSSVSDGVRQSACLHARELIEQRQLGPRSRVLEIASNDGYQLQWFAQAGINTLGIDPVPGPSAAAREKGIPVLQEFFDAELAGEILREHGRADVILAKNVLAHVANPFDFLQGVCQLLKPDGLASFEFPYLGNLLEQGQFDTIYHEHASYLAIAPLDRLFQRCGLGIVSIRTVELHGGSLRVDVRKGFDAGSSHRMRWLEAETRSGINRPESWETFARQVHEKLAGIREEWRRLKHRDLRLAAYGAAAKGTMLLNLCGFDHGDIEFVVDRNPHKHGKFVAGTGIEIRPVEELLRAKSDVALLLAWNFASEIRSQQSAFEAAGGRFLIPIPVPELTHPKQKPGAIS